MSIRVHCTCGHEFRVKDKYAGKTGRCPHCGQHVQVPHEAAAAGSTPAAAGKDAATASKSALRSRGSERRQLARALAKRLTAPSLGDASAMEVAGHCWPARETGRDYYDVVQLHDGSWALAIATVQAHGLEAAHSALELRAATHALALGYSDPGAILTLLNRAFVADWPEDRSATMLLARYEPQSRLLCYASAAHPAAYLMDAQGNTKWTLESTDCSLALLGHTMYGTSSPVRLEPGETLMMPSAGLATAKAADGAPLGTARLLHALGANSRQPATAMIAPLRQLLPAGLPPQDQSVLIMKAR